MNRAAVRALLMRRSLHANKDLGQNFLVDPALADEIAELGGADPSCAVLEIGAGLGALTGALARRARRVLAYEIDAGLVRALREEGALPPNVELVHADALRADLAADLDRLGRPARVVSNLPYSVSSPLLRRLLDLRDRLEGWLVMVQREMALRVSAAPGSRDYGSLAVLHHLAVRVERVRDVPPHAFFPEPQITSTLVRLVPRSDSPLEAGELPQVERLVRAAFSTRRKTLVNALRGAGIGSREVVEERCRVLGIPLRARAEILEPDVLLALSRSLRERPLA